MQRKRWFLILIPATSEKFGLQKYRSHQIPSYKQVPGKNEKNPTLLRWHKKAFRKQNLGGDIGAGWETWNPNSPHPPNYKSPSTPIASKSHCSFQSRQTQLHIFFKLYQMPFFFVCIQLVTGFLCPSPFAQWQFWLIFQKNEQVTHFFVALAVSRESPGKSAGRCCCGRSPSSQHPHLPPNAAGSRERPSSPLRVFTSPAPPLPLPSFWLWSLVAFATPEQLGGIQLRSCIAY